MVRCPSCKLSIRVATKNRPYSFNCPVCEMELTLDRENRLWGALKKRKTEDEALPLACDGCGNGVEAHWWFCPFCAATLKKLSEYETKNSCLNCTLPTEPEWSFCAFCSSPQAKKDEEVVIVEDTEKESETPTASEEELILPPDDRAGEVTGKSGGGFLSAQEEREEAGADGGGESESEASEEEKNNICPKCGKNIEPDWLVCRYCMSKLKKRDEQMNCPSCGKKIKPGRMICPFCSSDLARHESNEEEELSGYPEHVPSSFSEPEPVEEPEEKSYYEEYDGGAGEGYGVVAGEEKYEEEQMEEWEKPEFPLVIECRYCGRKMRVRRAGKFKCPNCGEIDWIDEYSRFFDEKDYKEGTPLCPVCNMSTQYSEEERDYYCWACKKYISEMR